MGLIDRLKAVFSSGNGESDRGTGAGSGLGTNAKGVEYQCLTCGSVFNTARERCPQCGGSEIGERGGSFEF